MLHFDTITGGLEAVLHFQPLGAVYFRRARSVRNRVTAGRVNPDRTGRCYW